MTTKTKRKTEAEMVAAWNARHPIGTQVEVSVGKTKIDHECTTLTNAYLNGQQKAAIKINIEEACFDAEWLLRHIKPI